MLPGNPRQVRTNYRCSDQGLAGFACRTSTAPDSAESQAEAIPSRNANFHGAPAGPPHLVLADGNRPVIACGMKPGGLGLQGKFIVALLVAAALPFLVGLVVFESTGYRHLLEERGKLHQIQATSLARALEQAAEAQGDRLRTYLAADTALLRHLASIHPGAPMLPEHEAATARIEEMWASMPRDDPFLSDLLGNAGAASLRNYQSAHRECAEILAADAWGRLAAATGKTSDYNQADESWWNQGMKLSSGRQITELLRFDSSSGVFSIDVVLPLREGGTVLGVVKMSTDVTSLFSSLGFEEVRSQGRWEIVLPGGRVIAGSPAGGPAADYSAALTAIHGKSDGWALLENSAGEIRMTGFHAMGSANNLPGAYVLFSSDRDQVVGPLQQSFMEIGLAAAAVLSLCGSIGFLLIRRNILKPLALLGSAARSISDSAKLRVLPRGAASIGEEDRRLAESELHRIETIHTGDEIESLAADLAAMTSRVLRYQRELENEVAAKTAVIREDLELAREFQNALLPTLHARESSTEDTGGLRLQFAHFYQPTASLGGDFFDIIELDSHRTGVLIADVMGHGARSALVTAILRALVRNHAEAAADPGCFLTEINRHLHEVMTRSGQTLFVTAFLMVFDTHSGSARWAVAGHPAPLHARRGSGRDPAPLWSEPPKQMALGLLADATYESHEIVLRNGDVFLLHTDGASEAENPAGEPFGMQRLNASFDESLDGPMAALPAKVVCDVAAWRKVRHFDDDVCLVAVEAVRPPAPAAPAAAESHTPELAVP